MMVPKPKLLTQMSKRCWQNSKSFKVSHFCITNLESSSMIVSRQGKTTLIPDRSDSSPLGEWRPALPFPRSKLKPWWSLSSWANAHLYQATCQRPHTHRFILACCHWQCQHTRTYCNNKSCGSGYLKPTISTTWHWRRDCYTNVNSLLWWLLSR